MKPVDIWYRAGDIERGPRYDWRTGYTKIRLGVDSGCCRIFLTTQPWMTKREAQSFSKKRGAKATFFDSREEAIAALKLAVKEAG